MANVEIVGMNTINIPLTIPGMDRGSTALKNTCIGLAPKSCAAST